MLRKNIDYQILNENGFQDFVGIVQSSKITCTIIFDDESKFTASPEHRISIYGKWYEIKSIKPNRKIGGKRVVRIFQDDFQYVYDPVEVANGNSYISDGIISHNCAFLGSSKSLISGAKLGSIATFQPIFEKDHLKIFEEPIKKHSYVMTVDTSRGQHLDYSAFAVIDITEMPYKVVATFKDNTISPTAYPYLIFQVCQKYNDSHCLIEVNDLGEMVSSALFYEFEYENVYFTYKDELNEGRGYPGVRTTKKVKSIGCSTLKDLVEKEQLLVQSHDILAELSVFVQKGASYASDSDASGGGVNDDLTTCLWLFSWLTKQPLFSELTDTNIRAILAKKTEEYINENMLPFGGRYDGLEDISTDVLDINRFGGSQGDPMTNWIYS